MRLILHAGTHKTGTTSIQKVLADNREWLRERGLIYPDGKSAFGKTSIPHHRFCRSLNGTDPDGFRKANLFLFEARRHGGPSDTIVISSEAAYKHVYGHSGWDHFSSDDYWFRRERYLKRLADALSAFDVELILFFRERESFAVSLYKEVMTKDYWRGDFQTFLKHFAPWFNYDRQIEAFGHAFPRMRVLLYEDACRNGLMATFFNVIGFPLPPGAETVWERRSAAAAPQLANAKVPQLRHWRLKY